MTFLLHAPIMQRAYDLNVDCTKKWTKKAMFTVQANRSLGALQHQVQCAICSNSFVLVTGQFLYIIERNTKGQNKPHELDKKKKNSSVYKFGMNENKKSCYYNIQDL